ncbi:MAG: hypothetical protein MUE74_09125 [Bacteroidales bacterium]|nr:hypothetical protein [Bacteroidales bacterium]
MPQRFLLIIAFHLVFIQTIFCQPAGSTSFRITTRYNFYSYETSGEALLSVPKNLVFSNLNISISVNNRELGSWKGVPGRNIVRIPLTLDLPPQQYRIRASISASGRKDIQNADGSLTILSYKPNEVKTDRLTGGLVVNKRQFFPFGFYTYSPVHPTLPEEEVVKGFNMISPYQRILSETFSQRKVYMDRCAEIGMKVHFNLLSVSGGGGVNSLIEGITPDEKKERLVNEIIAFRDHPALLAWYIADEPNGYKISPDSLQKIYELVHELDPWHPVSVVFMAPFLSSRLYADALDIVMADPYPVPDMPVSMVGNTAGQLATEFAGRKPVWIVPQAFGGGEWWTREPTTQELRAMTYQAIIKGARGIQYFVRQGLNLFPKSTGAWAECGRMAVEIAQLIPWLLSDEKTVTVRSGSENVIVTSAMHDGQLMIMAANKLNTPQRADFYMEGSCSGKARIIFENRSVNVSGGYFYDQLSALGTQVYIMTVKRTSDTLKPWPGNLIRDPGFEDLSSPGVPAACYARSGGDRGSTYFTDSREHAEGNRSVRFITPEENKGIRLRFFPFDSRPGATYSISVWAKGDPEQGLNRSGSKSSKYFTVSLGEYGLKRFLLTEDWKEFVTNVTIPYNPKESSRINVILQMPSEGVAWFDMLQVAECEDINRSINPELLIIDL